MRTLFTLFLFHLSISVYATNYFVANDGDDLNNGLTEQTAWKTAVKVWSSTGIINPGDVIAFKRGDVFDISNQHYTTESLSGTSGTPTIITSYGTGARAIITSDKDRTPTWADQGSNIWTTALGEGRRIFRNGTELLLASSLAQLQNPAYGTGIWFNGVDTASIYSATDPNLDTYSWTEAYCFRLQDQSYIKFHDIEIVGGYYESIRLIASNNIEFNNTTIGKHSRHAFNVEGCTNITIDGNTIDAHFTVDMSHLPQDNSDYRGVSDGIFLRAGSSHCIIRNNYLKNWGHTSINVNGSDIANPTVNNEVYDNEMTCPDILYGRAIATEGYAEDNEVYNNYIHDTATQNQIGGYRNHVHHNIIKDLVKPVMMSNPINGSGMNIHNYFKGVVDNIIENNIIINTEGQGIYMESVNSDINDTSGNIVRNNILYNCGSLVNHIAIRFIEDVGIGIHSNLFQNNLVYNSGTLLTCQASRGGGITTVEGFNNANRDISNTIAGDPLFVNVASDWKLQTGSPALNRGIDALSTVDYYGNIAPYLTTPVDIGIYEANTLDTIAPIISTITIEDAAPTNVVMVFNKVVTGTNLGFTIAGTTSTTFARISGSGNTWTGVLGTAAVGGETITLSYSESTGDFEDVNTSPNALEDIATQSVNNKVVVDDGNFVVNGTFETDVIGWEASPNGITIIASVGGQLEITAVADNANAFQAISGLAVGDDYLFEYDVIQGTNNLNYSISVNGALTKNHATDFGAGNSFIFTAVATSINVLLYANYSDVGAQTVYYDNIRVTAAAGNNDVDEDGMPDQWEIDNFGGTSEQDGGPEDDYDHDGASNLDEYLVGTGPTNASDFFHIKEFSNQTGSVLLTWDSVLDRLYSVQWSSNLIDGTWISFPDATNIPGTDAACRPGQSMPYTTYVT